MRRRKKKNYRIKMKQGLMRDGPGHNIQFRFLKGKTYHLYPMPTDPTYSVAVYKITGIVTLLGETVAIFSHYKGR